jgi:5'-nucleotidase (lipoprotein e(P4) family)
MRDVAESFSLLRVKPMERERLKKGCITFPRLVAYKLFDTLQFQASESVSMRFAVSLIFSVVFAIVFVPTVESPKYENLNAVLWVQTSAEYKASAVQTYRAASKALLEGLKDPHWTAATEQDADFESLPPAVILDLDETVLDSSVFQSRLVVQGQDYSESLWKNWVDERGARLVPGAMEFLQFAHTHGVAPLYITNRVCDPKNDLDPTVQTLRNLRLPLEPVADRLFCAMPGETEKTRRREICAAKFRILLLFGDQLGDFIQLAPVNSTGDHTSLSLDDRNKLYVTYESLWGERWFLLSNPMYGSWEDPLGYDPKEKLKYLKR